MTAVVTAVVTAGMWEAVRAVSLANEATQMATNAKKAETVRRTLVVGQLVAHSRSADAEESTAARFVARCWRSLATACACNARLKRAASSASSRSPCA